MNMPREQVNRLKIVLAEEQKSNKWLAEQLGKDQATISKWVTNSSQPDLKNLLRIAKTLNVDVARLLNADVLNEDQQVNLQSATSDNMVLSENKEE
nr:MAG TPA: helix-turn-helix domain protein [Caudoviricetes sp.]